MRFWKRLLIVFLAVIMIAPGVNLLQIEGLEEAAVYADDDIMSYDEAVEAVRDAMTDRESEETIYIRLQHEYDANATEEERKEALKKAVTPIMQQLLEDVFDETDESDEGDYLRFHEDQITYKYSYNYKDSILRIQCLLRYYTTEEQEEAVEDAIEEILESFRFTEKTTDREKLEAIYAFVTENARYYFEDINHKDYKDLSEEEKMHHAFVSSTETLQYSAYANLIEGFSVCQGYANLIYRMLKEVGIDNRIITGTSFNPAREDYENHAWNIVKLDGVYHNIDATWDSQYVHWGMEHEYFLLNDEDFDNHYRDAQYKTEEFYKKYPMVKSSIGGEEEEKPESHTHEYKETQREEATCFSDGYITYVCKDSKCKHTKEKILPATYNLQDGVTVTLQQTKVTFTGSEQKPKVVLTDRKNVCIEAEKSQDFTIQYKNNINPGKATVTITGKKGSGYTGKLTATFTIERKKGPRFTQLDVQASKTDSTIILKWSGISGASEYRIYRQDNGGTQKLIGKTKSTAYTDKKVSNSVTHTYSVVAVWKGQETLADQYTLLGVPKVSLANASTGITVSWNKISGATGYEVYRKNGSRYTRLTTIKSGNTVSYTDKKANTNGTTYQYYVTALNANSKSFHISDASIVRLSAPSTTVANVSNGVKISWKKNSKASGYVVYRKSGKGSYAKIATISKNSTVSYVDKKAVNGTTYTYVVKAVKGNTTSVSSSAKSLTFVSVPKISSASNSGSKTITVKWKKNTKATGYQIYYKLGSSSKTITVKKASAVTYSIKKLTKGKTYEVKIRAYKTVSKTNYYSAWSTAKKVKVSK